MSHSLPLRLVYSLCLSVALILGGCNSEKVAGGAGAGNPPQAQVTVSLKAEVVATAVKKIGLSLKDGDRPKVADSLGRAVTLTGVICRMQSLEFDFPEGVNCKNLQDLTCDGNKVSLNQARDVDLLTGIVTPAIAPLELPPGRVPRLRLEFVSSDGGHSEDSPQNYNVVISGTVTEAGQADKPFEFSLALKEGMDFKPADGLTLKAGINYSLRLLWAVNHWFDHVDMLKCLSQSGSPAKDGKVHFYGDEACDEAGKRIRQNIEASGKAENSEF